jgi:malonyl CoA-acyl carrier protein transacylase
MQDIKRIGSLFESAGARMYMPLQVSAAFHSRYVAESANAFAEFLENIYLDKPRMPVVANVTARPYLSGPASETIKQLLVKQITSPVQWMQSVRFLLGQGVTEFRETGPGNVLTRFVQEIQKVGGLS